MAKQREQTVPRSKGEITELLEDTLDALTSACARFDRGDTREYRHISALIRSLCRDTKMSKSLLGQVGHKTRKYLTSSPVLAAGNKLSECHLVELVVRPKLKDKAAAWQAALDDAPMEFVSFEDWWTNPVVMQPHGVQFSRESLVGYVADQDGGVHVDPEIGKAFQTMRKEAFNYTDGRSTTDHVDRHVIRQIAHELIKSLRPSYRRSQRLVGSYAIFRVPVFAESGETAVKPLDGYHQTPDIAQCPCGSELPFHTCHRKGVSTPRPMQLTGGEARVPEGAAYARFGFSVMPS